MIDRTVFFPASSCRFKVGWLRKNFSEPRDAYNHYSYQGGQQHSTATHTSVRSTVDATTQTDVPDQQYVSQAFSLHCIEAGVSVPDDFLELSLSAMNQTQLSGRSNVVYSLVKGLGTQRPDGSDSCFPSQ